MRDFQARSGRTGRRRRKEARRKRAQLRAAAARNLAGIARWKVFDPDCGDLMSVQEFQEGVDSGMFTDYDGFGSYVARGRVSPRDFRPSTFQVLPGLTHVAWYNK